MIVSYQDSHDPIKLVVVLFDDIIPVKAPLKNDGIRMGEVWLMKRAGAVPT